MDPSLAKKTTEPPLADEPRHPEWPGTPSTHPARELSFPGEDGGKSLAEMAQRDLSATLQLLAERAQYITGATGAAIALRNHEEMVCRASAGSSAPEVGTQLQINSGLSGESVRSRQTLRCDDAYTDTRVNRESCEALGIRSVVVMPLLRNDEVIGVFELFSDQPNVFETRDLAALERMGAMVHTALEQSAMGFQPGAPGHFDPGYPPGAAIAVTDSVDEHPSPHHEPPSSVASASPQLETAGRSAQSTGGITFHIRMPAAAAPAPAPEASAASPAQVSETLPETDEELDFLEMPSASAAAAPTGSETSTVDDVLSEGEAAPVTAEPKVSANPIPQPVSEEAPIPASRTAVAGLRKCLACGFPVSEGRQLCLDCEKKKKEATPRTSDAAPIPPATPASAVAPSSATALTPAEEPLPRFLGGEGESELSWIASHKILLATLLIAILAIVGAYLLR